MTLKFNRGLGGGIGPHRCAKFHQSRSRCSGDIVLTDKKKKIIIIIIGNGHSHDTHTLTSETITRVALRRVTRTRIGVVPAALTGMAMVVCGKTSM